ncbi:hypothetical protein PSPHG_CDS_0136 [Pseudomonas phage Psxphi15]
MGLTLGVGHDSGRSSLTVDNTQRICIHSYAVRVGPLENGSPLRCFRTYP